MGRARIIGEKARIANPALEALEFLVGDWRTTGSHPHIPGKTLYGRTSFAWHEGGAFLMMRSEVEDPQIPDGLAIIGSDDVAGGYAMIYFDERGTSRLFEVLVGDRTVTWRRDNPEFSQSMTIAAAQGGDRLVGKGRMSKDGGAWTDDLSQVFERDGG